MSKVLSYFYPITKKVASDISGTLEITWYNGKKQLNSKNANYSYGSLQEILKFGLEKMNLKKVNSILLLGLGGGSVIETLRQDFKYNKPIVAVDIDPVIIHIAKTEFHHQEDENLKIVCQDALQFMASNSEQFDLIIIDLFVDVEVPKSFLDLSFWKDVVAACGTNGNILFNASLEKTKSKALQEVIAFLKAHIYITEVYEKVNQANTLVIAQGL